MLLGEGARTESLVSLTHKESVWAAHCVLLALCPFFAAPSPAAATAVAVLTTLSLAADLLGRPAFRLLMPRVATYNVVQRRIDPKALGTVILVATTDSVVRRPTTRFLAILAVAGALTTTLFVSLTHLGLHGPAAQALHALAFAATTGSVLGWTLFHKRHETVDVGGPVAALAAWRSLDAEPPDRLERWLAFTAAGHADQSGLEALLHSLPGHLPKPLLVVAFDSVGRSPLGVVVSEGTLRRVFHRPTGPALVERLGWRGLRVEPRDLPRSTPGDAARRLGERALVLTGGTSPPDFGAALHASSVAVHAIRLFQSDLEAG